MIVSFVILIFIIVVGVIFTRLFNASGGRVKQFNYTQSTPLFSAAERSFLGVLDMAISDQCRVFGKVRVADVLSPAKGLDKNRWQSAFNKISSKHFDFVLCNKETLAIIAVIELDDKSHRHIKTVTRDALLDAACSSAHLKMIRFQAKASYQPIEVREIIQKEIALLTP